MITIFRQKEIADEAIQLLYETFSKQTRGNKSLENLMAYNPAIAVVAGGMVRDHFFGNLAKDIDIFIRQDEMPTDPELREQFILSTFINATWKISKFDVEEIEDKYSHNIVEVYAFTNPDGQEGNIIVKDNKSWPELLAEFTCNLSKCYSTHGESMYHEDFVHGVLNETLEFQKYSTTEKYFEKIVQRFPNFKVRMV